MHMATKTQMAFTVNYSISFLPPEVQHPVIYTSPEERIYLAELLQITLYPIQTFWANATYQRVVSASG